MQVLYPSEVLTLYLDERRGVQENTSMREGSPRELLRPNAGIFLCSRTQVRVETILRFFLGRDEQYNSSTISKTIIYSRLQLVQVFILISRM